MKKYINKFLIASILFFISLNAFAFIPLLALPFTATEALSAAVLAAVRNPALINAARTAAFGAVESGKVGIGLKGVGVFAGTTAAGVLIAEGIASSSSSLRQISSSYNSSNVYYIGQDQTNTTQMRPTILHKILIDDSTGLQYDTCVLHSNSVVGSNVDASFNSWYVDDDQSGINMAMSYQGCVSGPSALTFDFTNAPLHEYDIITDSRGNKGYLDSSGNFVPTYLATPQELSTAYGNETGQADFNNLLWDSFGDKPDEYQGTTYDEALAIANGYAGTNNGSLEDFPLLPTALNPTGSNDPAINSTGGSNVIDNPAGTTGTTTQTGTTTTTTTTTNADGTTSTSTSTSTNTTDVAENYDYRGYLSRIVSNTANTAENTKDIKDLFNRKIEQPTSLDLSTSVNALSNSLGTTQQIQDSIPKMEIDFDSFSVVPNVFNSVPCQNINYEVNGQTYTWKLASLCEIMHLFSLFLLAFAVYDSLPIILRALQA